MTTEQLRERAQADLEERRRMASFPHVDNGQLPAGAPMYYWCRYCKWLSDLLPETWFLGRPRQVCTECQAMLDRGWL